MLKVKSNFKTSREHADSEGGMNNNIPQSLCVRLVLLSFNNGNSPIGKHRIIGGSLFLGEQIKKQEMEITA